ncbi:MAG: hypothetical protein MJ192_11595 [Clostridia bacterium]|nr:hypothetical protein [Clostridia bacterium]
MIRPIIRLSETDPTLWEELGAWFKEWFDRTFSTGYNDYQHIQMGTGTIVTLRNIVLGLFIGLIIAACVAFYDKNRLGAFVRKLVKEECLSTEKAKTLNELGFLKNPGVRNSLKRGKVLGNTVHCVEKEQYQAEVEAARQAYIEKTGSEDGFGMPDYKMDLNTAHFYIPDEEHYAAEVRFEEKGSGWRALVLVIVLAVVGAALVCYLLPDMIQLLDNMIDILSPDDVVN